MPIELNLRIYHWFDKFRQNFKAYNFKKNQLKQNNLNI